AVDALQIALVDDDLAAQREGTRVVDREGESADRPKVLGDVLAESAVAPGGSAGEASVAVEDLDAGAVELRLHAVDDLGPLAPPVAASPQEFSELRLRVRVVERHHPLDVRNRLQVASHGAADSPGRGVGGSQRRMRLLEKRQLLIQRVVLAI